MSGPSYLYIYLVLCLHGQESEERQEGGMRKRWDDNAVAEDHRWESNLAHYMANCN